MSVMCKMKNSCCATKGLCVHEKLMNGCRNADGIHGNRPLGFTLVLMLWNHWLSMVQAWGYGGNCSRRWHRAHLM